MKKLGELLLLPNVLSKDFSHELFLPTSVAKAVETLDGLIAESEKEGRAYLKLFLPSIQQFPIFLLNEHTKELDDLIQPLLEGKRLGIISDAGLPILADPGYNLVRKAKELKIAVKAFVGPSALPYALMLSGLPAQRFAFHGYLPKEPQKLLKVLEERSFQEQATQVFIEAPYRNQKLFGQLLATLNNQTLLCIATDLTAATEEVLTYPIAQWKKEANIDIQKRPTIFLFIKESK